MSNEELMEKLIELTDEIKDQDNPYNLLKIAKTFIEAEMNETHHFEDEIIFDEEEENE